MADNDKEFVEYVVKAIVENPDKVTVERKVDEMGVLLELTVDPADMGKIIGKEGRTAKAIRTLLRVLGAQLNARVNLKIIEPEGGLGRTSVANAEMATEEVAEDKPKTTTKDDLKDLSDEE
ncbi:KH domain-containing protein [Patescibacteria group bacterium]|nr:KH domain-containing protein [Patescibacteria group bacterium]